MRIHFYSLKLFLITFLFIMATTIISSCTKKVEISTEIKTIKLMFYDEREYRNLYQNLLDFKFPEYHLEVIAYRPIHQPGVVIEDYIHFIKEQAPDIIVIPEAIPHTFQQFIDHGLLLDLDPYIVKDQFNLSELLPSITEQIRAQGSGRLYGLATGFHSQALFYNKDIFDRFRVDYPRDFMSYEEVLELAERFPFPEPDNPVFGFHKQRQTPVDLFLTIGEVERLKWLDESRPEVTLDSQGWKNIFSFVARAYQQGAIFDSTLLERQLAENTDFKDYSQVMEAARLRNLFTSDMAAMTIESHILMDDIARFAPEMKWGVVTVPVDPANPQQTFTIKPGQMYSLYAGSAVLEDAWRVFQFIHGEEMAKLTSRTPRLLDRSLPVRTELIPDHEGESLAAFYKLSIEEKPVNEMILPLAFHQAFRQIWTQQFNAVLQDVISIEEAIQTIQEQGNKELMKVLADRED